MYHSLDKLIVKDVINRVTQLIRMWKTRGIGRLIPKEDVFITPLTLVVYLEEGL